MNWGKYTQIWHRYYTDSYHKLNAGVLMLDNLPCLEPPVKAALPAQSPTHVGLGQLNRDKPFWKNIIG